MEHIVERVVSTAQQRLNEPLTLDDLAKMAMFSKFHFARMFRRVTGLPPRRFLYALRLQEAKRLLVTTRLGVAAISLQVGYQSVGTFTSRFTASVGVPPTVYRRLRGDVASELQDEPPDPTASGVISGRVEPPDRGRFGGATLVGLFRSSVPEGRPVRCDVVDWPGEWSFHHVPSGQWYVLAVSPTPGVDGSGPVEPRRTMMSLSGPVKVGSDTPAAHVTVQLRPMRPIDPPILAGLFGHPTY